jgi:hypothetical protein
MSTVLPHCEPHEMPAGKAAHCPLNCCPADPKDQVLRRDISNRRKRRALHRKGPIIFKELSMTNPTASDAKFIEVTCYDGSIGRDGKYARVKLPHPMTKLEAREFCCKMNHCPPEAFHTAS